MRVFCKKGICGVALLLGIFSQGGGLPASADQYIFADRQTASNLVLDDMRGGFVTDSGLQFSLGIIKAVLVNGVLETVSSLNIPNIASMGSSLASQQNSSQMNAVTLAQTPGSTNVATLIQNIGYGVLVQNKANNTFIQGMSIVNMTTNSASVFRQMNIMTNMSQQFINFSR